MYVQYWQLVGSCWSIFGFLNNCFSSLAQLPSWQHWWNEHLQIVTALEGQQAAKRPRHGRTLVQAMKGCRLLDLCNMSSFLNYYPKAHTLLDCSDRCCCHHPVWVGGPILTQHYGSDMSGKLRSVFSMFANTCLLSSTTIQRHTLFWIARTDAAAITHFRSPRLLQSELFFSRSALRCLWYIMFLSLL